MSHTKMNGSGRRLFSFLLVLSALLLILSGSSPAVEPVRPRTAQRAPQALIEEPTVSAAQPDTSELYVFEDDIHRIEFTPEGLILRFKVDGSSAALWITEILGTEGPVVWTRDRETLGFTLEEDTVTYRRTPAVTELYFIDRAGLHQVWGFSGNPLRHPGDLLIIGEILTPLQVDLVDGRIRFSKGDSWVDSFCSFQARDPRGNTLEITPKLEGKRVTLTVPGSWLFGITGPGPAGG